MPGNLQEPRPKVGGSEKITIDLSHSDLGRTDLLVRDGFYPDRTGLIRTAVRDRLERHPAVADRVR